MRPKACEPARSRRASRSGSSGRGNGMRSMATRLSDAAGHVDALPEAHGGEQAGGLVGGELLEQPGLGEVALGEDRQVVAEAQLQRGGRLVEHPEAGEQRERATAGRLDEVAELVGERLDVAGVARVGQVGGAVEERVRLVVERAADIELGDLRRGRRRGAPGSWAGSVALVSTAVRLSQRRSCSRPDTSSGATRSTGLASVPSTHTTWSSLTRSTPDEVGEQRAGGLHAGARALVRRGLGRVERARCGRRPAPAPRGPGPR